MNQEDVVDFFKWLQIGIDSGWCSEVVCDTHDGVPMTDEEMEEWEEGYDPCIFVVRIWT